MTNRIFIVEDHPRLRETYALFIAAVSELEVCGIAGTAAEALAEVPNQNPDLIIVDISLPDVSGIELSRQLRVQFPSLPILIVSGHKLDHISHLVAEAGADGYIDKKEAYSTLIPTIHQILNT